MRKNPVLLRQAPLSGKVNALTNYQWKDGGKILQATIDGKHDVTADFDAIVCELLLDRAPEALAILDEMTTAGSALTERDPDETREELRRFYEALREIVERHNAGPHVNREES